MISACVCVCAQFAYIVDEQKQQSTGQQQSNAEQQRVGYHAGGYDALGGGWTHWSRSLMITVLIEHKRYE